MKLIIDVVIFPRQICKFMRQTESWVLFLYGEYNFLLSLLRAACDSKVTFC